MTKRPMKKRPWQAPRKPACLRSLQGGNPDTRHTWDAAAYFVMNDAFVRAAIAAGHTPTRSE